MTSPTDNTGLNGQKCILNPQVKGQLLIRIFIRRLIKGLRFFYESMKGELKRFSPFLFNKLRMDFVSYMTLGRREVDQFVKMEQMAKGHTKSVVLNSKLYVVN